VKPGVSTHPDSTLVDRALEYLARGPADSAGVTLEVLGIEQAPLVVAERLAAALLGADPRIQRDHAGRWCLALEAGTAPDLSTCTFAVVDVETTGSQPAKSDKITEIAVVLVRDGRIETAFETLVNPERPIPPAVTRVTRITNEMLRNQPTFSEIVDDLLAALGGRVFVAHNLAFDWRFVWSEVRRARDVRLDGPRLCTVKLTRRLVPGLKNRGLDSVSRYFGIEIEDRHRAGGDAQATAGVLVRLLERATDAGAKTLADLETADLRSHPGRSGARKSAAPTWMDAV